MDTTNHSATPGSGGSDIGSSSSDGNGSRSVDTSSPRCLVPSSPTGTQLMSEFNAAADAEGSGSSSSPSSSGDQLHRLILIPPVDSAVSMDHVLIIEGLFLRNRQGSPSGTAHSASPVDNNGLGTPSRARSSTSTSFVDNNGPRNRISISDITLVSSASDGASGAGSGGRRNASNNGQFTQRREENRGMQAPWDRRFEFGSSTRQQGQGAGSSNIHHHPGPEFTFLNVRPRPGFRYPPNVNTELGPGPGPEYAFPGDSPPPPRLPPWMAPGHGLTLGMGPPVPGHVYLPGYNIPPSPPVIMMPPPGFYAPTRVPIRRPSGLYPPPGVTIRPPTTREGAPLLPEQTPSRVRVTITAPPPREGGASASEEPEPTPPKPKPKPKPEEPETFVWPPTTEEDASFTQTLYGPSTSGRPRLPVFQDICPDDETNSPPSPPLPPPPPPPPRP